MKPSLLAIVLLGATLLLAPIAGAATTPSVVVLTYSGPINPASAEYIARGFADAEARNAAAFVLQLDTPGGLDSSMREIIQHEMNARVTVIVFVAPRGARAASAGCIIVLAADVAAMAPGTNMGAAHPIYLSGGTVSEKILNDAAAYARSIASARHRNSEWAERAVRESVSATSQEALSLNIIDLTANDVTELLSKLDSKTIHRADGDITLSLAGATQVEIAMDSRERILETLTDPTVAYVLFLLGALAVLIEIFSPHGFVTGTIGAVAVILALVGLISMPIQISGAIVLLLGMLLLGLPRMPGFRISLYAIGSVALVWAVMLGAVVRLVLRSRHQPVLMGTQRVAGSSGIAKTNLAPRGVVLVNSEEWDALADAPPIAKGERISVVSVEGLTLHVRKIS
jgi:membrane-bound serine protease (ClpP class)